MKLATPIGLPQTHFSLRSERLLQFASAAMARHWPLLVALVYLDCLGGILLGRGPYEFSQILWHLAAIAVSLLLAALGSRQESPPTAASQPGPRHPRRRLAACGLMLAALAGVMAAACLHRVAHPLPLDRLLRGLVGAGCLILALALCARMAGLRRAERPPDSARLAEGSLP